MDSSNTETKLFGVPKDTQTAPETKQEATEKVDEQKSDAPQKETDAEPASPESETVDTDNEKSVPEEAKTDVSKEKDGPEEKKPAPKVDFGKPTEPKKEDSTKNEETRSISENEVLAYLKTNGLEVERLSDLSKKVTLNEEVEKFKKFNEETGLGAKEFYNVNRDWSNEPKETRIAEYLKLKDPNISDEDIQIQLELMTVTEDDEEELNEKDFKKKKLEFNRMDREALNFLSEKQKEYSVPQNTNRTQTKPTEQDIAEAHRPYWNSRDKSLKEFNEVKFNIEGIGEISVPVDDEDKKLVSQNTETMEAFVDRWREGESLNTKKLVEDNVWGIEPIRQKLIQSIVEQTHALTLENFSKENRNVNLDKPPKESEKTNKEGLIIERPEHRKKEKFGSPLI